MTVEEFKEILKQECPGKWKGCNALQGLNIIAKYLPEGGISGADHDIIYSVGVEELIKAGITKEDAVALRNLNWMVENGTGLACFV